LLGANSIIQHDAMLSNRAKVAFPRCHIPISNRVNRRGANARSVLASPHVLGTPITIVLALRSRSNDERVLSFQQATRNSHRLSGAGSVSVCFPLMGPVRPRAYLVIPYKAKMISLPTLKLT
jgi:hypothetical protein